MTERRFVRVQEKGQVTLPTEIRKRLGLKKGDLVSVTETDEGLLIVPQEVVAAKLLDRLGDALREKGVSFEELMESGAEIRQQLAEERYGKPPSDKSA